MKKDAYVGAASKNIEGIAIAEPIIVCGRVNLHNTRGNGVSFVLICGVSLVDVLIISMGSLSPSEPIDVASASR